MYVLGGIHIPIVMDAAFGTCPGSDIKRKRVEERNAPDIAAADAEGFTARFDN
jgi:hypothetical protein